MASTDLQQLKQLIHKAKAKVLGYDTKLGGEGIKPFVKITLKRDDKIIEFTSEEEDVCFYTFQLKKTTNPNGDPEIVEVRDIGTYYDNIEQLLDLDKSKFKQAVEDAAKGKFKFSYNPMELFSRFLADEDQTSNDFVVLRDHHFQMIAHFGLLQYNLDRYIKHMKGHSPKFAAYFTLIDDLLVKFITMQDNPVKMHFYCAEVFGIDTERLLIQASQQRAYMENLISRLAKCSPISGDEGIEYLIGFYHRLAEICKKPIGALCIAIEKTESRNRTTRRGFLEDCEYLHFHPVYSNLVTHLKPRIRNAVAHTSYEIDKQRKTVRFPDEKCKVIEEYDYRQISNMAHELRNLVPALLFAIELHKIKSALWVADSPEYKTSLLKIGNRA